MHTIIPRWAPFTRKMRLWRSDFMLTALTTFENDRRDVIRSLKPLDLVWDDHISFVV